MKDDNRGPGVRPFERARLGGLSVFLVTSGMVGRYLMFCLMFFFALGRWLNFVSPVLVELTSGAFSSRIPNASSASTTRSALYDNEEVSGGCHLGSDSVE